jgi:hypothetical protein
MNFSELRNESANEFTDISSEAYRKYAFAGAVLEISNPIALSVSESGGHRVLSGDGESYYIPKGWLYLEWRAKDGQPHFVK